MPPIAAFQNPCLEDTAGLSQGGAPAKTQADLRETLNRGSEAATASCLATP
jgi:hypothetical protein